MAPLGTVRSRGPRAKRGNCLVSPRISMALLISFGSFLNFPGQIINLAGLQARFCGFPECPPQQLPSGREFDLSASVLALFGHEGAQSLAAEDNALALQFLVSTLDRNHTDQQVFSKLTEGRQWAAGLEAAFTDLALEVVDDL